MNQEKRIKIKVIKRSAEKEKSAPSAQGGWGGKTVKKQDRKNKVFIKKSISRPVKGIIGPEKKKTFVMIGVVIIMLIVFAAWISLLNHNLSRIKTTNDSFWSRLMTGLKDDFAGIKNSLEGIKNSINTNYSQTNESELEEKIFPDIKE